VLCENVTRAPAGAGKRIQGRFTLDGVSVVNGAQTVMSIAEAVAEAPDQSQHARVWIRVISLATCPDDFASQITRATNTQNRVIDSDFVALDPTQERLCRDFSITLRKMYVIKRGQETASPEDGCTLHDAALALACAHPDVRFAVLAQHSPGSLFRPDEESAYQELFRPQLSAAETWRWVQANREVEQAVSLASAGFAGTRRAVASHGLRLVAHLTMGALDRSRIAEPLEEWDSQLERAAELAPRILELLIRRTADEFPALPALTVFRSSARASQLAALVRADLAGTAAEPTPTQPNRTAAPSEPAQEVIFHLSGRGSSARGRLHGNGMIVRAGSVAARQTVPSLQHNPTAVNRRQWLIDQGVLRPGFDRHAYVLTRDEYFESASQAAAVILGRPSNGRTEWRTAEGLSINQVIGSGRSPQE
jgi:hypothetical protein